MKHEKNALNETTKHTPEAIKPVRKIKKFIYVLILPLVVISGLVFANRETKNEPVEKTVDRPLSAAEKEAELKKWEATPAGMLYKKWETSPEGEKVLTCAAKIMPHIKDSSNMEAVVTSLSLPPGSQLGFGMMIKINGDAYILSFGLENVANEFQQLRSLKVNDKIMIRSHHVSHAPRYFFPIISGDYVEKDGKVMYKHTPGKGC